MPQILRIGPYIIFFWSNEGQPLEPIHVHVAEGDPRPNATKIWITSAGKTLLCNNNSNISPSVLKKIMRQIEANIDMIVNAWISYFGEIRYYC